MATLEERVATVEEQTETLEDVLEQFVRQTGGAILRMEQMVEDLKETAEQDRREWRRSLADMEARAEQSRQEWRQSLADMEARAEQSRQEWRRSLADMEARAEQSRQEWRQSLADMEARAEQDRREWRQSLAGMEARAEQDRQTARQERRELFRQLGDISNRLGTIVEDIIAPSLRRMAPEEFGCGPVIFFAERIAKRHSDDPGREREFEALYVGERAILLNETKANARPEYARAFVQFLRSDEFFSYFPEYRSKPIVPVFSSLHIPADLVTYLTHQGIYAVAMGDETMTVLNLDAVRNQSSPL